MDNVNITQPSSTSGGGCPICDPRCPCCGRSLRPAFAPPSPPNPWHPVSPLNPWPPKPFTHPQNPHPLLPKTPPLVWF